MNPIQVSIRPGVKSDLPQVLELIRVLAEYERAPEEVVNTVEMMERDGFGPNPAFGLFVAEYDNRIAGISLFFWRYSTWKGRRLYLEDIVVHDAYRGKGIGKLLFDRTIQYAAEHESQGMTWQVLEWNEPAINFYKKYGANLDGEWINCSLEVDQLKAFARRI